MQITDPRYTNRKKTNISQFRSAIQSRPALPRKPDSHYFQYPLRFVCDVQLPDTQSCGRPSHELLNRDSHLSLTPDRLHSAVVVCIQAICVRQRDFTFLLFAWRHKFCYFTTNARRWSNACLLADQLLFFPLKTAIYPLLRFSLHRLRHRCHYFCWKFNRHQWVCTQTNLKMHGRLWAI